jgi:hypothetical protein
MAFVLQTDASFKGIGFRELYSGGLSPAGQDTEEQITVIKIPGGNTSVLQSAGRTMNPVTIPIACTSAALASLRGAVGSNGSLVYHGGTVTARLTKVGEPRKAAMEDVYDVYQASLTFYW